LKTLKELDEVSAGQYKLQKHGGVEDWDQEAVDHQEGQLQVLEKAGCEHAKKAAGGD
jgi:hypothetical protein